MHIDDAVRFDVGAGVHRNRCVGGFYPALAFFVSGNHLIIGLSGRAAPTL